MDFTLTSPTLFSTFFNVLVYVIAVGVFYGSFSRIPRMAPHGLPPHKGRRVDSVLIISLLFLCVFMSNSSDWFSYREMVQEYDFSPGAFNYGEPIYHVIIKLVGRNYILFRTIVWGASLFMFAETVRRFGGDPNYGLFILLCVYFLKFNYARVSLALASYFYGLSFLLIKDRKPLVLRIALCVAFMILAYCSHRSSLILIASTLFMLAPLNIYTILIGLACAPILGNLVQTMIPQVLIADAGADGAGYLQEKIGAYAEMEQPSASLIGMFSISLDYLSLFLPLVVSTFVVLKKKMMMPKVIVSIDKIILGLVCISFVALFLGLDNNVMFYRVLYMAIIPTIVVLVYMLQHRMMGWRIYRTILFFGLLVQIYRLSYSLYTIIR